MSKYTPGPWEVNPDDPYEIVSEDYGGIANVPNEPAENAAIMAEMRANAILIAKAPDLRAALAALVEAVDKLDGVQDAAIDIWISNCTESAIEQARAAIAAAGGEAGDGP